MAFQQLNVQFKADLRQLTSSLGQASGKVGAFAQKNSAAFKQVGLAAAAVGAAVVAMTALAVKSFAEFEKAIADVRTQLAFGREEELAGFEQGIRDISAATGRASTELATGLATILDAGAVTRNELDSLAITAKFVTATGGDLQQTIKSTAAIIRNFGVETGKTEQILDILFETARTGGAVSQQELQNVLKKSGIIAAGAGASFEEVAGILAVLTARGFDARAINGLLNESTDAVTKSTVARAAGATAAGLTIDRLAFSEGKTLEVLKKLNNADAESLSILIPTVKSRQLLQALFDDETETRRIFNKVAAATGVVEEDFLKRQQDLNQITKELKATFDALVVEGIEPVIPAIKSIVETIKVATQGFREFSQTNPELAASLAGVVVVLGPLLIALGGIIGLLPVLAGGLKSVRTGLLLVRGAVLLAIGPWSLLATAIGAVVVLLLGRGIKAFLDIRAAEQKLREGIKDTTTTLERQAEATTELIESLDLLTESEQAELEAASDRERQAARNLDIIRSVKDATEEQTKAAFDSVLAARQATDQLQRRLKNQQLFRQALKDSTEANLEVAKAERARIQAQKDAEVQTAREAKVIADATEALRKLRVFLDGSTEGTKKFRDGFASIIQGLEAGLGTFDKAFEALKRIVETDFTAELKLRTPSDDAIREAEEQIQRTLEDIELANLEGDERRRRQEEINLERTKRDLAIRLKDEKDAVDEAIVIQAAKTAQIKKNAEAIAEQEKTTADVIRKKAENDFAATKKRIEQGLEIFTKRTDQLLKVHDLRSKQILADLEREKRARGENVQAIDAETAAIRRQSEALISLEIGGRVAIPGAVTEQQAATQFNVQFDKTFVDASKSLAKSAGTIAESISSTQDAPAAPAPRVLRSGQAGIEFVPATGLFRLHRGERVIPAGENPLARGGAGVQAERTVTIVNLIDPQMVPQILAQFPNAVLNIVNADILQNGQTRRVIKAAGS